MALKMEEALNEVKRAKEEVADLRKSLAEREATEIGADKTKGNNLEEQKLAQEVQKKQAMMAQIEEFERFKADQMRQMQEQQHNFQVQLQQMAEEQKRGIAAQTLTQAFQATPQAEATVNAHSMAAPVTPSMVPEMVTVGQHLATSEDKMLRGLRQKLAEAGADLTSDSDNEHTESKEEVRRRSRSGGPFSPRSRLRASGQESELESARRRITGKGGLGVAPQTVPTITKRRGR